MQMQGEQAEANMLLLKAHAHREKVGMWLGFILAVTLIICGTLIILSGHDVAGFAVVTTPAITIAGVFIYNRRRRKD